MSLAITQHFDLSEFASHDGVSYPAEWIADRLKPLCEMLEIVRETLGGRAITILSGYRSPAHNKAVGGASASQHMAGRAADIQVNGIAPSDVHRCALQLFNDGKIQLGGIGLYPGWVHLDIRPWIGHLAMWDGAKVGDEVTS